MIQPLPLVTIVTPCYNAAAFLEDTIRSVLAQTYPHFEYIIMDGGSTDTTAQIVARYQQDPRLTFISEPDKGQTDAVNKGWRRANGEILTWLNADDVYEPDTVAQAVAALNDHPDAMWIYGTEVPVDRDGKPTPFRHAAIPWDYERLLNHNCYITQPTVFLRRAVWETFGELDADIHFGMDYEYWLRIGRRFAGHHAPQVRVIVKRYRETKTVSGGHKRMIELEALARRHGGRGLPAAYHAEWTEDALQRSVRAVRRGQWTQARAAFKDIFRYPRTLPRGIVKFLVRALLPERAENWLRRRMMPMDRP